MAESTKANLLHILRLPDRWKRPLLLSLNHPVANLPEAGLTHLEVSQTENGLKLQLDVNIGEHFEALGLEREILRAILLEMMYRDRNGMVAGTRYVLPPDWLVEAVLTFAPNHECDRERIPELLRIMLRKGRLTSLDSVVRQDVSLLDPSSRRLHAACALALLKLLLESSDGPHRLAQFIVDLPDAGNDPTEDLRAHFPQILGRSSEKKWALSIASLSAGDRGGILAAKQTRERLDRLATISFRQRDGTRQEVSLHQYKVILRQPAYARALGEMCQQLILLNAHAHPLYRPVAAEYVELVRLLMLHKARHFEERLAGAESYRHRAQEQEFQIEDYLNWFEATQLHRMSGTFDDYLKAARLAESEQRHRRDPISIYLDSVEMEMR